MLLAKLLGWAAGSTTGSCVVCSRGWRAAAGPPPKVAAKAAAGGGASLAASARPAAEAYWGWATDMPLLGLHDSGSALLRLPASVAGVEERGVAGVQDLQHDARGWARTRGIGGRIGLEETPNPTKRTEPRASSNAPFFHSPCQLNLDGACALPGALSTDLPSHLLLTLHTRAPVA